MAWDHGRGEAFGAEVAARGAVAAASGEPELCVKLWPIERAAMARCGEWVRCGHVSELMAPSMWTVRSL